jgi:hypothetical protein
MGASTVLAAKRRAANQKKRNEKKTPAKAVKTQPETEKKEKGNGG